MLKGLVSLVSCPFPGGQYLYHQVPSKGWVSGGGYVQGVGTHPQGWVCLWGWVCPVDGWVLTPLMWVCPGVGTHPQDTWNTTDTVQKRVVRILLLNLYRHLIKYLERYYCYVYSI